MPRKATMQLDPEKLALAYLGAKRHVIDSGFAAEIDWQTENDFERLTESELLREAAWVVLSSGFRESVVRRKFPGISAAFLNWSGANEIIRLIDGCKEAALRVFGHRQKIDAIARIVGRVAEERFPTIKEHIRRDGIAFIQKWPFMGAATSLHLAKNLGLPVVKPDRHLVRVAGAAGYRTPEQMCHVIAKVVGDSVAVVDVVIWRYATIEPGYLAAFQPSDTSCRSKQRRLAVTGRVEPAT
jgi:hypothetical protein